MILVVQARVESNRFPGKVLLPFRGIAILSRVLEVGTRACGKQNVICATSKEKSDDSVACLAQAGGWKVRRGSLENVWSRFRDIAIVQDAEWFVRLCADSPLLSPEIILTMMNLICPDLDLVTNIYPRTFPHGQSVEILHRRLFLEERFFPQTKEDQEHVTPQLYRLPGVRLINHLNPQGDQSHLRWSVEEPGDIERLEKLTRG